MHQTSLVLYLTALTSSNHNEMPLCTICDQLWRSLLTCLWNTCMHQTNLVFWLIHSIQWNPSETSQNGSKQGISQMAIWAWWLIGSMIDSSNSERLRGFCDWRMDRQTDICDCRVAFATEKRYCGRYQTNFISDTFKPSAIRWNIRSPNLNRILRSNTKGTHFIKVSRK